MSNPEYESEDIDSARMTFTEHLTELRDRIIRSAMAIGLLVLICYFFSDPIFHAVARPLQPLAARAEALRSADGPYLAAIDSKGDRRWEGALGPELSQLDAVAFTSDSEGRPVLVANATAAKLGAFGIVLTLAPESIQDGAPYRVESVQTWSGMRFRGARPDNEGNLVLLGDKTSDDPAAPVELETVYRWSDEDADSRATLRAALEPFLPERAAATAGAGSWVSLSPFEAFIVKIRLAVIAGLILSLPVILYQVRAFIFPGLRASERRIINVMLYGSTGLILAGVSVAYFLIFPLILDVLIAWTPEGVLQQFRMSETVDQILKSLLAFAIAFQMPLVVLLLVYLDILQPSTLKEYRRVAIVGMAFAAAVLTPPDPVSLALMLIPLIIMYEICIWASYIVIRKRDAARVADGA